MEKTWLSSRSSNPLTWLTQQKRFYPRFYNVCREKGQTGLWARRSIIREGCLKRLCPMSDPLPVLMEEERSRALVDEQKQQAGPCGKKQIFNYSGPPNISDLKVKPNTQIEPRHQWVTSGDGTEQESCAPRLQQGPLLCFILYQLKCPHFPGGAPHRTCCIHPILIVSMRHVWHMS